MERTIQPSEIKLSTFNACPGKEALKELLGIFAPHAQILDIGGYPYELWRNDPATLTIGISYDIDKEDLIEEVAGMGMLARDAQADEVEYRVIGKMVNGEYTDKYCVYRLWWD